MKAPGGTPRDVVELGPIVNTHGVRGELRLLPYNPATSLLHPGMEILLGRDSERRRATLRGVRRHKRFLLLVLEGVDSLDAAQALVGWAVLVPASVLPPPGPEEAYHFQLEGLAVVTTTGEAVGTVAEVFTTAANDVCVVRRGDREVLIPFVADVIKSVDTEGGQIVIEPLPGLLDETEAKP